MSFSHPRLFPLLRVASVSVLLDLISFTLFRAAFWVAFSPRVVPAGPDVAYAWYLGAKFDLRLALLFCLPLLLLGPISLFFPFRSRRHRLVWFALTVAVRAVLFLTLAIDLGHYGWEESRLHAGALDHLYATGTALGLIWEHYPVVPALLGLAAFTSLYGWMANRWAWTPAAKVQLVWRGWRRAGAIFAVVAAVASGLYGKWSWYPLRWSEAFFTTDNFLSSLALNPVLYFFDTLSNRSADYDLTAARSAFPRIAPFLGIDPTESSPLDFRRQEQPAVTRARPANVVIIVLESFSALKSGSTNNPLDPTPHFDALAREGTLFTHCFVPRPPTARSIFSTLFGIPDINPNRSASRNPRVVRQQTIVNEFKAHEKLYLIGGSATWGNIRGMLRHNIPGLRLYEEGTFKSSRADVWGITDLDLFHNAHRIFSETREPFFAVIQTAGNHPPYTVPSDVRNFALVRRTDSDLRNAGFRSNDELNAFRFIDFSLGQFFQLAKGADYFGNTLFILFGDHGTVTPLDVPWNRLGLVGHHVPLAFCGGALPKLWRGKTVDHTVSTLDVLPSAVSLAGISYTNATLGRDLFSPRPDSLHLAFIDRGSRSGLLTDDYFFLVDPAGSKHVYLYRSEQPLDDLAATEPRLMEKMSALHGGFRESAKYLLYHNSPSGSRSLEAD